MERLLGNGRPSRPPQLHTVDRNEPVVAWETGLPVKLKDGVTGQVRTVVLPVIGTLSSTHMSSFYVLEDPETRRKFIAKTPNNLGRGNEKDLVNDAGRRAAEREGKVAQIAHAAGITGIPEFIDRVVHPNFRRRKKWWQRHNPIGYKTFYTIMPYFEGIDFIHSSLLKRGRSAVFNIIQKELGKVAQLHRAGLIHGDIKPEQFFLTPYDDILMDFGLSRIINGTTDTSFHKDLRRTGRKEMNGTLGYMDPRLNDPENPLEAPTVQSDLYAFGIMLIDLFAHVNIVELHPLKGTLVAVPSERLMSDVEKRGIPPLLIAVIKKAITFQYVSAEEMQQDLEELKKIPDFLEWLSKSMRENMPRARNEFERKYLDRP